MISRHLFFGFLPLLRASLLSVVSLLAVIHPVLAESEFTSNTSVPETIPKAVPNTTAFIPDPSVKTVPLEVQIILTDGTNTELQTQLFKDISISLLEKDEFPAQTDFLFKRAEKELFNALKAFGYYQFLWIDTFDLPGEHALSI